MGRAKARAALDAAFATEIGSLFSFLVLNLTDAPAGPPPDVDAQQKFKTGLAIRQRAHALASAEIDRLFTE